MTYEVPNKSGDQNPLVELESLSTIDRLTPGLVRAALNFLDAHSPAAQSDAEVVLGAANFGASLYPNDEDWQAVLESAASVYAHRLTMQQSATDAEI